MENDKKKEQLSQEQIDQCISILKTLNEDTDQIFEIPKAERIELITEAGRLSRPSREEFSRRKKDAKKAAKRKAAERDKRARNNTGILSAREASVFIAPKMISLTGEEENREEKHVAPRNCYVC